MTLVLFFCSDDNFSSSGLSKMFRGMFIGILDHVDRNAFGGGVTRLFGEEAWLPVSALIHTKGIRMC